MNSGLNKKKMRQQDETLIAQRDASVFGILTPRGGSYNCSFRLTSQALSNEHHRPSNSWRTPAYMDDGAESAGHEKLESKPCATQGYLLSKGLKDRTVVRQSSSVTAVVGLLPVLADKVIQFLDSLFGDQLRESNLSNLLPRSEGAWS
jgi:hypothetical protein